VSGTFCSQEQSLLLPAFSFKLKVLGVKAEAKAGQNVCP